MKKGRNGCRLERLFEKGLRGKYAAELESQGPT